MMNRRSAKRERTGMDGRLGNMERMTCGIVSPVAQNGHGERDARKKKRARTDDDSKGTHPCHGMRKSVQREIDFGSRIRTTECEGELEKGHSCPPTGAETAIHDSDVRRGAAQFCVCDDETDSPICNTAKDDEEKQPCNEPCTTHGVG